MFRFTIRDLLWLMVVVGLALGWWADNARIQKAVSKLERDQRELHEELQDKMTILDQVQRNSGESRRYIQPLTIIYKITYPNGKIFVGRDRTGSLSYFGNPNLDLLTHDFMYPQRRSFTITREILWEGSGTPAEVTQKETEFILELRSNDPDIGYNEWPKFKPT